MTTMRKTMETRIGFESVGGELCRAGEDWDGHPAFEGVWLKDVVLGRDSGGQVSVHMVRVDAGCSLAVHSHDWSWEMHEVLAGSGVLVLDGNERRYGPGTRSLIPMGCGHAVTAGSEGLALLATFIPALK